MNTLGNEFLQSAIRRYKSYKQLGDKTFDQLGEADFHFRPNEVSNSIATIIQHLNGNMRSRWTNLLTEDGEKEWRQRDEEFEIHNHTREQLIQMWEDGWKCLLDTLQSLKEEDLLTTIYIRKEPLTVTDAILRQLAHYPSHVGQIMYIGKIIKGDAWKSLSIEKGQSQAYNNSDGVKDPAKLMK
ncbi:DUF1572 family protein [Pseudoflavitalea sp. G-6-1-2]|uniref:DUF1572 family protein n=1 Tax=Pseudoflavitalea sp. G-6-1-2 TaxID=2728841 RepID=UPI00146E496B|nr:DUF1572 family protein [Pseudoflavitalea sp. G-6-1-2]NML22128.1 DUF1572 family protein [Pseudoflavitalea sp. G-6-1-2]